MKQAFGGLFRRKEKKVKVSDADGESDNEFREKLQEAEEAKAQYEELLRVATHAAQQAQGFARSQHNLAACFSETLGNSDDMDIADCFKRLGRVQAEIGKLVDQYTAHLHQTMVVSTSELKDEWEQMDGARKDWEVKRQACETLRSRLMRRRQSRGWGQNGDEPPLEDNATLQAQDDYDDAHMALGRQLMAIEQRRPKVLIQQAARLHAAQMTLFTRALQNVHAIEPYIKDLSIQRSVDRRLPNGDGYSDYEHEDEERSIADSVEHNPPWDDTDSRGSTPAGHCEIKDLSPEMAAEWSTLLHSVDQTLQEMGEQTLDTKDAVFAVNALLMASSEGKRHHLTDHLYQRSQSGPLSLNTHSGSRSAPLSSTGVPLHLLQNAGGANPGPKTAPGEEAGTSAADGGRRKSNLHIQGGLKAEALSKSGPLTHSGTSAAVGSATNHHIAPSPTTALPTPPPLTRSAGSRGGTSFRAAKSGPVFPAGGLAQTRSVYSHNPRSVGQIFQGGDLGSGKVTGQSSGQGTRPRHSSVYASKSGPIIMTQPRGAPISSTGDPDSLTTDSIPYSLPTEASHGPPRVSPDPIVPKSGPIGRSPLAKSSISPNTSPPLSPPRPPSPPLLYQLPAPPQGGSAPPAGGHFLGGGPLIRSAEPVLPGSSGLPGSAPEGEGPTPLPAPPATGNLLLRRNSSHGRSDHVINGGNGLSINIPQHKHFVHSQSARTRIMPQTPLSPIAPSDDGTTTPSPSYIPQGVGPQYALSNGALEENHIRRSMSFEIAPPSSKAPNSDELPQRKQVPSVSPERPLVTISSPLPAMPPSTPPERPESQGALNALAGVEREELIKAVTSENFRWKYVDDVPFKGPKQVPELETLEPDQREHLIRTLARAVKSRREAFIDGNTHGFADLPSDLRPQETC